MSWIDVGPRAALPPAGMMECEASGRALLLYDLSGQVHATDAVCPHQAAWFSQGRITGTAIDCPRHMGRFDIVTGAKLRGPDCPDLRTYSARVVEGRVLVELDVA